MTYFMDQVQLEACCGIWVYPAVWVDGEKVKKRMVSIRSNWAPFHECEITTVQLITDIHWK